jgi:2'-5' RNA ligase
MAMAESFRGFIAIEIVESIRFELTSLLKKHIPAPSPGIRFVQPALIHLTLKFLGEVSAGQAAEISDCLASICATTAPFRFQVIGLGTFPSWDRPRTLWAGIKFPPALELLYHQIETAIFGIGFPREGRIFSPHITLARVSDHCNLVAIQKAIHPLKLIQDPNFGMNPVSVIVFFKSTLQPKGPIYTPYSIHKFFGNKV